MADDPAHLSTAEKAPSQFQYGAEESSDDPEVAGERTTAIEGHTKHDEHDMWRMGKIQELRVGFLLSIRIFIYLLILLLKLHCSQALRGPIAHYQHSASPRS